MKGKDGRGVVEAVGGVMVEEETMKGGFTVGKEYYGITLRTQCYYFKKIEI